MSESFLGRWSRRKAEAKRGEEPPPKSDTGVPVAKPDMPPPGQPDPGPPATAEEIAALPPIESLTADSDITGFLRKGVPHALRNAALQRMWRLDPAIRDFVGEARDYSWDWNVPGGVPGNGPLEVTPDMQGMVDRLFSRGEPRTEPEAARPTAEAPSPETSPIEADQDQANTQPTTSRVADAPPAGRRDAPDGPPPGEDESALPAPDAKRRHGGALPG